MSEIPCYLSKSPLVWILNPYPTENTSHYQPHLPSSTRPIWIPGKVKSIECEKVVITTVWEPQLSVQYSNEELVTSILPYHTDLAMEDMGELIEPHEAALLHNCYLRYYEDFIYTYAGDILVAINPYKVIYDNTGSSIYGVEAMKQYRNCKRNKRIQNVSFSQDVLSSPTPTLPPHVFEVADIAFQAMIQLNGKNQSIIISGESGAGKSETTKLIMQYLANVANMAIDNDIPSLEETEENKTRNEEKDWRIVRKPNRVKKRKSTIFGSLAHPFTFLNSNGKGLESIILETNPVLEAFGNSKTLRNDNSSRFGKLIEIMFDENSRVLGGEITSYLLEKSRVVSQQEGERNYHVFFQLLAGCSQEEKIKWKLKDISYYTILKKRAPKDTEICCDLENFRKLKDVMSMVGINQDSQDYFFRILSAIMLIGNTKFLEKEVTQVCPLSLLDLHEAEELLGLGKNELSSNLICRVMEANREVTFLPLHIGDAEAARDALAKSLYSCIFNEVVYCINTTIRGSPERKKSSKTIGVLDIFGFEVFPNNSFEQLCVNYANEKLHQYFLQFVFKLEIGLYSDEGISIGDITYEDNQSIIDTIAKKPFGALWLLEESCLFPHFTDDTFLQKLHKAHRDNPNYIVTSGNFRFCFIIKHSPSQIMYNVDGFLEKNKDRVSRNIENTLIKSSIGFLAKFYINQVEQYDLNPRGGLTGSSCFLGGKFRMEIENLVQILGKTEPHFIKCIKSNNVKLPELFDHSMIQNQFRYLGVFDSIKIRKAGFCFRCSLKEFVNRYGIILSCSHEFSKQVIAHPQETAQHVANLLYNLSEMKLVETYQLGKTMIFLRQKAITILETLRIQTTSQKYKAVQRLSGFWKFYKAKKQFKGFQRFQKAMITVQNLWKCYSYRVGYQQLRHSTLLLQKVYRRYRHHHHYRQLKQTTLLVQTLFRGQTRRKKYQLLRKATILIQKIIKGKIYFRKYQQLYQATLLIQKTYRAFFLRLIDYKNRFKLACLVQSWFRGWKERHVFIETVEAITLKRRKLKILSSTIRIQRQWRKHLSNVRHYCLQKSTMIIENWYLGRKDYFSYLQMKSAAKKLHAIARGHLVRNAIHQAKTAQMMMNAIQSIRKDCREEASYLGHFNRLSSVGIDNHYYSIVYLDIMSDIHKIYPNGWAKSLLSLQNTLQSSMNSLSRIYLGYTHTVVLTSKGEVYTWGWGDAGQLGNGKLSNETKPFKIELQSIQPNGTLSIQRVAVGKDHTVVLSSEGILYSWGDNKYGQLGQVHFKNCNVPKRVEMLHKGVKQIACGAFHSVALLEGGSILTWGHPSQVGFGDPSNLSKESYSIPRRLQSLGRTKIKTICCGHSFTLALSFKGDIFSWGNNTNGQLGLGDTKNRYYPTSIAAFRDCNGKITKIRYTIKKIACGASHALALSTERELFGWGNNSSGQLALGDFQYRDMPNGIKHFVGRQISGIACGWNNSCATVDHPQSTIYHWGGKGCNVGQKEITCNDESFKLSSKPVPIFDVPQNYNGKNWLLCSYSNSLSIVCLLFKKEKMSFSILESKKIAVSKERQLNRTYPIASTRHSNYHFPQSPVKKNKVFKKTCTFEEYSNLGKTWNSNLVYTDSLSPRKNETLTSPKPRMEPRMKERMKASKSKKNPQDQLDIMTFHKEKISPKHSSKSQTIRSPTLLLQKNTTNPIISNLNSSLVLSTSTETLPLPVSSPLPLPLPVPSPLSSSSSSLALIEKKDATLFNKQIPNKMTCRKKTSSLSSSSSCTSFSLSVYSPRKLTKKISSSSLPLSSPRKIAKNVSSYPSSSSSSLASAKKDIPVYSCNEKYVSLENPISSISIQKNQLMEEYKSLVGVKKEAIGSSPRQNVANTPTGDNMKETFLNPYLQRAFIRENKQEIAFS